MPKCLIIIFLFCLHVALATVPPPEPKPNVDEEIATIPKEYTEEDKEFIKKMHKDMPSLPKDMFDYTLLKMKELVITKLARDLMPEEIKETSFRKKLTPEEKADIKKKYEQRLAHERRRMESHLEQSLEKNREHISKLSREEIDSMIEELGKELAIADDKMKKVEL